MAFVHGKNAVLLLDDIKYSAYLNSIETSPEIELADVTVFDAEGHGFVPGLDTGQMTLGGFVDKAEDMSDPGGQDETIDSALQASAGSVITAAPDGLTRGNRATFMQTRAQGYAISTPVAEAVAFNATWQSDGQIDKGVSLHDLTAETSDGDGTAVDGAASSAAGGAAALHVTATAGTTPSTVVKVQHSADNSVWADLITFTAATAATAERKEVTGTVNRYVRETHDLDSDTTSITYAVVFARR